MDYDPITFLEILTNRLNNKEEITLYEIMQLDNAIGYFKKLRNDHAFLSSEFNRKNYLELNKGQKNETEV